MFDVGFPSDLHYRIAKQFNKSEYASYLVSYKAPKSIIDTFGFNVTFMKKLNTTMHGKYSIILLFPRPHKIIIFSLHIILGSGEGHRAYIYCRSKGIADLLKSDSRISEP